MVERLLSMQEVLGSISRFSKFSFSFFFSIVGFYVASVCYMLIKAYRAVRVPKCKHCLVFLSLTLILHHTANVPLEFKKCLYRKTVKCCQRTMSL